MNTSLEPGLSREKRRPWIIEIGPTLAVAFISIRSAVAALSLTYLSAGKKGLLSVSAFSLLYFGFVSALARWKLIQKNASASWLYWMKGVPASLTLGIIAIFIVAFMGTSQMAQGAFMLRVLVVVLALSSFISLLIKLLHLFRAKPLEGAIEGLKPLRRMPDLGMEGRRSVSSAARLLNVAGYLLEAALWTWLIVHYRYYSQSFLAQSLWVMASLWLFLLSSWLHSVGAIVTAFRRPRPGRGGVGGASGAEA